MIYIIGIGPGGNMDYLTLKAYEIIKEKANIGLYIGEMIGKDIQDLFKDKELVLGDISKEKVKQIIEESYSKNKNLVILMPGDSSFYSGQYGEQYMLHEYVEMFKKQHYKYEIIPGITALNSICAKLSIDITSFSSNQNVFITSIERTRDRNQFNEKKIRKVCSTKPNIILYQSYRDWKLIKQILISENYDSNTRIIFAYKVSWKDEEKIIDTTLQNTEKDLTNNRIEKHTIILILPNVVKDD
jgi:precorrin-4 methylase